MRVLLLLAVLLAVPGFAAPLGEDDVVLVEEIENFGQTTALEPVAMDDASGKLAMALNSADSIAQGAVKLAAGKYTVLVSVWAPAGDQDGFYVDVRDVRDRRVPPGQRAWHTLAYNIEAAAEEIVPISVVVQEVGLRVDQIAVVKGTYKTDEVRAVDVPRGKMQGVQVKLEDLPRLATRAHLASVPEAPLQLGADTLLQCSFDTEAEGAMGSHERVDGKFGQALYLGAPDGRLVLDTSKLTFGSEGTVEFWVRPRPAQRLWWDQGWHYFLHCEPAEGQPEQAVTIDISRHPSTQLRATVATRDGKAKEAASIATGEASIEDWHHLLFSWDFTRKPQYIWFLLDGVGTQVHFTPQFAPTQFGRIEIGNAPLGSGLPYLPIDGAVDDVVVSGKSVRTRLQRTLGG